MSNFVFFLFALFATACLAVEKRRDDKVCNMYIGFVFFH